MGSTSLSPDSRSHLGLEKILYITEGRTEKRLVNLKWWRSDLNVERKEYD